MTSCQQQPQTPGQRTPARSPELDAAYRRVELTYQDARREVFDLYPNGLPNPEQLTAEQRELLTELAFAERALDDLRKSRF